MYPITYEADFNPRPDRVTTFFRPLLAIPWIVVGTFWFVLFAFTHFFAWVAVTVLGRYPAWLYKFNSGVVRFWVRLSGWIDLQSDQWPPFGLADDPSYPIRVNIAPAAVQQRRLSAFFRAILALPVLLVYAYLTSQIAFLAACIAWLTIVFRGYMPEAVNTVLTYLHGFEARVLGYVAILTDDYPPVGLEAMREIPTPTTPAPPAS